MNLKKFQEKVQKKNFNFLLLKSQKFKKKNSIILL